MTTPQERLQHIFTALGTTHSQFASKYGVNRQTMYAISSGRNEPSLKLLMQLCELEPRISAEYLLRGQGGPLRELNAGKEAETMRALLELQSQVQTQISQFIEKKAKALQD